VKPTVFGDVKPSMTIAQEEIFGPVLSCIRFEDEAEAVSIANGTRYGLAASIWTTDVARAHALARRVRSGVVWINCFSEFDDVAPFGGYKQSGWGRDLSHHALDGFLQEKAVWTKLPE
jgi:acyl-CoA reductase-like NAD-dependent aldehyde dehydrogenase